MPIQSQAYMRQRQDSRMECFVLKNPTWLTWRAWLWFHPRESREKVSLLLYCSVKEVPAEIRFIATCIIKEILHYSFLRGITAISWCDRKMPSSKSPLPAFPRSAGGLAGGWQHEGGELERPGAVGGVGPARLCQQVCAVTQLIPPPCWANEGKDSI